MTFMQLMAYMAGILAIGGFVPYVRAILRGKQPQKSTWLIWAILDSIILAGMIRAKTTNYQIIGAVIGVWIVVGLAFAYGKPGWNLTDKLCLFGAAIGIALMPFSPVLCIIASSTVVFLGSIPTFIETWNDPGCEDKLAWTIFFVSCIASIIAIPEWGFATATQPIMFFLVSITMMYLLYRRPRTAAQTREA